MEEPGMGNLWVRGLSCKIFGKSKTWKWFLNAPPTRQTDAQHSSWAPQCPASSVPIPAGMIKSFIDPLKQKYFSPAVPSGCFSLYRQSAERLICWDIDGAVCAFGGAGAGGIWVCLCPSVYVMGRGFAGWEWQEKSIGSSENSEAHGKIKPWMLSEVHMRPCQEWSASAYSCSITPSYWVSFTPVPSTNQGKPMKLQVGFCVPMLLQVKVGCLWDETKLLALGWSKTQYPTFSVNWPS